MITFCCSALHFEVPVGKEMERVLIKSFCDELGILHFLVVGHGWLSEERKNFYYLRGNPVESDPYHDYT
jgi:hypothetical protein